MSEAEECISKHFESVGRQTKDALARWAAKDALAAHTVYSEWLLQEALVHWPNGWTYTIEAVDPPSSEPTWFAIRAVCQTRPESIAFYAEFVGRALQYAASQIKTREEQWTAWQLTNLSTN